MLELKNKYIEYLEKHRYDEISNEILFLKPYQLLREKYLDKDLRIDGNFFSSPNIANALISKLGGINPSDNVIDPCCGAGDLLLAYVNRLPKYKDPQKIIDSWSKVIYGNDTNADLVDITKLRLVMAAYFMCGEKHSIDDCIHTWNTFQFPHLSTGDALTIDVSKAQVILLNPPYQQKKILTKYSWTSGKTSMAAIFLYELFKKNPQAHFAAILPDVIRAGTRYQKLRNELSMFNWERATIYGRFDKQTDVDVFLISNRNNQFAAVDYQKQSDTISKYFDVHVGSIVPHRDPIVGRKHFYLTAKNTPGGSELKVFCEKYRSKRKPFTGPFLVIKRTSSPDDKRRCVATVINSKKNFYVENHLLVLLPKDKSVKTCEKARQFFDSETCNQMINVSIRCRHLTITAIKNLPYQNKEKGNE